MASWKRVNSEPLTVESRVRVCDENGREGYVSVRWLRQRPLFYGAVYAETGKVIDHPNYGQQNETRILDDDPSF